MEVSVLLGQEVSMPKIQGIFNFYLGALQKANKVKFLKLRW